MKTKDTAAESSAAASAIEVLFLRRRFDPAFHLGLGDIRLTLADQDAVIEDVNALLAACEVVSQSYVGDDDDVPPMVRRCRAAIRKARGQ